MKIDGINTTPIKSNLILMNRFVLLGVALLIGSSNVFAWGDSEQEALKGFLGGIIIKHLYDKHQDSKTDDSNSYGNYYGADSIGKHNLNNKTIPFECKNNPYVNNKRASDAWLQGCLVRMKEKQEMIEQQAYESGYQGY